AGSGRGISQGASRGCRQRSVVPSAQARVRNLTPDLRSAHIAACAERHSHHSAPARSSASRAARCDALHLPCRDFSSRVTSFPRCRTRVSGTPGLTPRFLRMAPLFAEDATGSVAVANVQVGSSHLSSREDSFICSCHSSRRDTMGLTPPPARRPRRFPPARGTTLFPWLRTKGTRPLLTACSPRAHVA